MTLGLSFLYYLYSYLMNTPDSNFLQIKNSKNERKRVLSNLALIQNNTGRRKTI